MRSSVLLIAFSALVAAQSSQPVPPATTITPSQPVIPTGLTPPGASSTAIGSSSGITTTTSTRTTSSSTTSSTDSTSTSSSTTQSNEEETSTNAAFALPTVGTFGLGAGLAGAALAAFV